jgi:biopolymer transport protein ExbB
MIHLSAAARCCARAAFSVRVLVAALLVVLALSSGPWGLPAALGAPAAPIGAGALGAPKAKAPTSLGEAFFIQRNPTTMQVEWVGSIIIWLILALSAASLALIVLYFWESRREALLPSKSLARAKALVKDGRIDELIEASASDESHFGLVLSAALREKHHGFLAMLRTAEQVADEDVLARLRKLEPLSVIGNIAPMLGLFGTVYGMILAFQEIEIARSSGSGVPPAAGIGTALVATFWGLVVAMPALSGFALLRNRVDGQTARASREIDSILESFRPAAPRG